MSHHIDSLTRTNPGRHMLRQWRVGISSLQFAELEEQLANCYGNEDLLDMLSELGAVLIGLRLPDEEPGTAQPARLVVSAEVHYE